MTLGPHQLSVESCDNREQEMRFWFKRQINDNAERLKRLLAKITSAMHNYCRDFQAETQEVDKTIEAAFEYQKMLEVLRADNLPKYEQKFKELLNQNTIREVVQFQARLDKQNQTIRERIEQINQSLVAIEYIRSFFNYASFQEPQLSGHIQRVLAIPTKRYQKREIDFLSVDEVDAILDATDRSTWIGRRDHALITLAIHTGMKVSELINLSCSDVTLGGGAYVHCTGKGRKDRSMPLGKTVSKVIEYWLGELDAKPSVPLFPSRQGNKLSRDTVAYILGKYVSLAEPRCSSLLKKRVSPHVLRHTAAVHLLQAGVDLSVIALWLGHESLESTQAYMSSDLTQKIKILEKTLPISAKPMTFKPDDKLMEFLKAL